MIPETPPTTVPEREKELRVLLAVEPARFLLVDRADLASVLSALTSLRSELETERQGREQAIEQAVKDAWRRCNGSCDIELARRQVGPDGDVPGNARECAQLWEREARRLRSELEQVKAVDWKAMLDEVAKLRERAEAAERELEQVKGKLARERQDHVESERAVVTANVANFRRAEAAEASLLEVSQQRDTYRQERDANEIALQAVREELETVTKERDALRDDNEHLHLANEGIHHYRLCANNVATGPHDAGVDECNRCRAEAAERELQAVRGELETARAQLAEAEGEKSHLRDALAHDRKQLSRLEALFARQDETLKTLVAKWRDISGRPQRPTGFGLCADELEAAVAPPQEPVNGMRAVHRAHRRMEMAELTPPQPTIGDT